MGVVRHDDAVMGASRAVDHEVLEERLRVKTEPLEGGDRPLLLGGHLGDDLAQAEITSSAEDVSGQHSTETVGPVSGSYLDANLAEMTLPGDLVVVEARISSQVAGCLG